MVAVILSSILNINKTHQVYKANLLNDVSLMFKIISIVLNIVISIFYSMQLDMDMVTRDYNLTLEPYKEK